jgi:hypothetical protein
MQLNRKLVLCAGTLLTVMASASAIAGDNFYVNRKVMSGAQCQPSNGTQWGDFLINPDGIRNIHPTYNRYVSCALVLDADANYDQADFDTTTTAGYWSVEVGLDYSQIAPATSLTTNCTVFRHNFDGTVQSEGFTVTGNGQIPTVSGGSAPTIATGATPINPDTFSINCRLPSKVKLTYIKTYEYMDTDGYYYTP